MPRASFTCARCRVWTGASRELASASVTSEETELQTVSGAVRIEWEAARCAAIRVSRETAGGEHGGTNSRATRAVTIDEDSIRTIDVYCPSPFSMTVIVQVDVSDAEQQCFLFSHVSSVSEKDGENAGDLGDVLRLNDRHDMLTFLSALHEHLKEVPLTGEARDLLAQKRTASLNSKNTVLKRRRTISPVDFYGRANSQRNVKPLDRSSDDGTHAWASFYERLQFNVSHSLMCQLEGTAPLSASFPRQQEAFEFVDQVLAFRERLSQQQRALSNIASQVREHEPRVFCFEGANEGKRRFWVTTLSAFWREYTTIPEGARHVYEIIREGVPCRLYFDLEFKKKLNPGVDGDALVSRLLSLVQLQIYRCYHLLIDRDKHVVQLESSTLEKFSRHLTIHFPNGELFVDNIHAGAFVRQLVHELVVARDDNEKSPFLVQDSASDAEQRQLFIDVGVYTRNRMFRVLGSSKFRKTAVLRPMETDQGAVLDHELFLRSIVCPRGSPPKATDSSQVRLLRCDDAVSLRRYGSSGGVRGGGAYGGHLQPMRSVESRASIYPALDAFIRSIATTGGAQGEIRAVHLLYADTPLEGEDPTSGEPAKIVYHMMKNRWCDNVGRAHKSNNVMFVVDVERREYVQRCHDPQCHAMDYRSPSRALPAHVELQSKLGADQ